MEALALKMINSEFDSWFYDESNAKVVSKPWGREVWINYTKGEVVGVNAKRYVLKKLYINSGTKTSYQYHLNKVETNFLMDGRVEAWFEVNGGQIDVKELGPGSIWTIPAGTKHRIITLTDVILIEASSPEVDDVIRIEDDTFRGNGRIQDEHD
jgi:mannose-6-phosphate isomerase-like protein (cupin superfamily)